jgi:subtilisin family serine protease
MTSNIRPLLAAVSTGVLCGLSVDSAQAQVLPDSAAARAFMADKAILEQGSRPQAIPNSVLVKFRPGVGRADQDSIISTLGGQRVRDFTLVEGLVHVRLPQNAAGVMQALAANPRVEYVEPDAVQSLESALVLPNDTYFHLQYGLYNTGQAVNGVSGIAGIDIRMPEAWIDIVGSNDCLVAVIDSGVQWNHPDFAYSGGSNIWVNDDSAGNRRDDDNNGYVDDFRGWDFYANDNNPADENGHGTHVAGIIAAAANNGIGISGTAWHCKIMPLRFLSRNGSGATSDAIAALNYAVMEGARVSNNSWGGGGYSQALSDAILAAGIKGHVFVAAAGNNGVNIDNTPFYPAAYPHSNIITVAAINNRGDLASFSNTGSVGVDIVAPGVDIASTYKSSSYAYLSGTSMAAPFVSGVLGLLASQQPFVTPEALIDRVLASGTPDDRYTGKVKSGRLLDGGAALQMERSAPLAPSNLAAWVQGSSVTLEWTDNANNESGFEVSRSGAPVVMLSANTESYVEDGLAAGSYTYSVRAYNEAGYSSVLTVEASVAADSGGAALPMAPESFAATNNNDGSATLGWTSSDSSITGFRLQREKQNKNGSWGGLTTMSLGAAARSYRDNTGSGTFRYSLFAINSQGETAALTMDGGNQLVVNVTRNGK